MKRRIVAWILLIGFILLFINLAFVRIQPTISLIIYLVVVVAFLFSNRKTKT